MPRSAPICFSLFIALTVFLAGCGGGGPAPVYPADLSNVEGSSSFIRAGLGGSISTSGARLYIPPGALPADAEITLKVIPPGMIVGGKEVAGGVEILPHLIDLNGPVLVEFQLKPNTFKPDSFPLARYRVENEFTPLAYRDETPCYALISDDGGRAMLSIDHFSVFALLTENANEKTDNTDVLFSSLENIQLRNDVSVFYDDDILADIRMRYYLGGWPQVNGSELWLPQLFDFAHPGEVYAPGTRYKLYKEIFTDLLSMNSFAVDFRGRSGLDVTPLDAVIPTIKLLFEQVKADQALQSSWVGIGTSNGYLNVLNMPELHQGYKFIERVIQAETLRYTSVSDALQSAIANGQLSLDLGQSLNTNGLRLTGSTSSDFDFFLRLSVSWAFSEMNCDAMTALLNETTLADFAAGFAAADSLNEVRTALWESNQHVAMAIVDYVAANQNAVLASGGLNFAQAVGSDAGKSDFTAIATPMSFGAFYSYFIRTGLLSQDAYTLSLQAASIGSGSVIYGLEPYLDGVFVWDPIMFARNLQRATLAGNLAGDFLTPDRVDTLAGQLGVAEPNRTFGELMRADLGYIYSRLKYDAWRYIVASQENGSYDWLRADTPWQVHSLLIEFDPESDARFHTQSNRNINENIYDEIVKMLNDLVVPVPKLPPKTGVDITIQ